MGREALKDLDVGRRDLLHHLVSRLVLLNSLLQGVDSANHLVCEHAQTPPVDAETMPVVQNDLRSKILWRSAESVG